MLNIFLEYVPGGSIHSLLKKFGGLPEDIIRTYTRQILLGLEYLHAHNIVHRGTRSPLPLLWLCSSLTRTPTPSRYQRRQYPCRSSRKDQAHRLWRLEAHRGRLEQDQGPKLASWYCLLDGSRGYVPARWRRRSSSLIHVLTPSLHASPSCLLALPSRSRAPRRPWKVRATRELCVCVSFLSSSLI